MRLLAFAGLLLSLALGLSLAGGDMPAAPRVETVTLNGHTFTLPEGFTIELAHKPKLIDRPITIDFDEQGRLYVADSSGSNAKVDVQLKERPHRIVRLEDSDGDGVFDRAVTFADKMMFPEGTLWYDGSLYVAAPPSIWKLTDKDGDGIADVRTEWFQGKTLTGCANDLHGPYLGLDGRIYWTKGAFAKQTYKRSDNSEWVTRAAHIFRARTDGTDIEPVMTGGMDNPVDVVFTPSGERIFTTTFFQHPAGGLRDGLVHAVYGAVYGKDHSPVYEHPWTAPTLMPPLTHMGPAAPSGLHRYESAAFGKEYTNNLFAAQFNLRKVSRHVLVPSGATFTTTDSDFVVSDNVDFHPTDVIEDADGSLLVVDTGGWYKLCCPSSQLVKADVHGAIYRVRKKGTAKVDDPRGLKLDWANVSAKWLGDPRPAVVRRAMHLLAKKGAAALPALEEAPRLAAVWTATRMDAPAARAFVRKALDSEGDARLAALHSVSLWRDKLALPKMVELLKHESPHARRVAAEAVGRVGDASAVPTLFEALRRPSDRVLEHSLTYAILEIADRDAAAKGLLDADPRVRRAALIALDGLRGGKLEPSQVAKAVASPDAALKEAAWWIAGRHPEWGGDLAALFRERMRDGGSGELAGRLARFAKGKEIQALLAERLRDGSQAERVLAAKAMAGSGLKPPPAAWVEGLTAALDGDADLARAAVAALRALPLKRDDYPGLAERLLLYGGDEKKPAELRLATLAAAPGGLDGVESNVFGLLLDKVGRDRPAIERALAVEVLAQAKLSRHQYLVLAERLPAVGPMEMDRLLDAFTRTTERAVGQRVVEALRASPARSSLRVDGVQARLAKYPPSVQKEVAALCAELDAELLKQREQLDKALASMKGGDIRRGQIVFNSQKAACVSCHAIGYVGGKVGPDLTRVGSIRSERDLLESILFPSASLVRSYEPVKLTTTAGKVYNGVVRRDAPDEIVLALTATEEVRIPRGQVEATEPSKVSIMPGGLEKILSPQDMADLVAFLRACK